MKKKILIIGGGFGGVKAGLLLSKHEDYEITIISDKSSFQYYPTLYLSATGGSQFLSEIPLGEIFGGKPVRIVKAKALYIHKDKKQVETDDGAVYGYDSVIISMGMVTNYFGVPGIEKYSFSIKSTDQSQAFKKHLQDQMYDTNKTDSHYVVIGAGPTGVELVASLPEYIQKLCEKTGVPKKNLHINLVEGLDRVLPTLSPKVSRIVLKRLKKLGVSVLLNQQVKEETPESLIVGKKHLKTQTVVWTAGVMNNPFFNNNGFIIGERGKVVVDKYLQAEKDIYVIGDNAQTTYSGMAQTALYDAHFVVKVITHRGPLSSIKQYKPKKPISVVPVGPKWAILSYGNVVIPGRAGWIMRRAADWLGYKDVEPWWKATTRSLTDVVKED